MKRMFQPSLARRVLLALMVAFLLVWLALVATDYVGFKQAALSARPLQSATRALADALVGQDADQAARVVRATEAQSNQLRREIAPPDDLGDLLFQLRRPDGTRVYASERIAQQPDAIDPGAAERVRVAGQDYWAARHDTPQWKLLVMEPVVADTTALRWAGSGLLHPLLIAFPLVLLPLWIAVRRGLRPLRDLVSSVSARDPNDFSPLGVELDLRYAELRPLVAAFNELLEKSRAGIARERAFVQDAAHELRTPLAVIATQAHALAAATGAPQQQQAKAALERAISRASHLVHQILTLASLEGGGGRAAQSVDLVEVVRQILIAAAPRAAAKDIEVALDSPEHLPATLDPAAFHSILENLLGNALLYCHAGSRIVVALSMDAAEVRLVVADDGPGIASDELPRIFDRFQRGREVSSPGSGLGLAIVRQAVRQMGGRVGLLPGLDGRGLAFAVSLPGQCGSLP